MVTFHRVNKQINNKYYKPIKFKKLMKKLFTFVVAAFAALTVSAKEDIDVSSIATDNVVTFAGQYSWKGINYGVTDEDTKVTTYADKSAFDYVVVEYSAGTCADVNLVAQYEKDGTTGQYGDNYYTTTATCNVFPGGGILAVKLDATHSKTMNAVALQNRSTAGTLTIKAAYFASEAEYAAAKAEADKLEKAVDVDATGGEHKLKAEAWGWDSKWMDKDVSEFNTIVFEVASVTGHGQITVQGTSATEVDKEGKPVAMNETVNLPASETAGKFMVDISKWGKVSQYAYQNINKPEGDEYGEADIKETTIVITKVYLTSKTVAELDPSTGISSAVAAPKANPNAPIYNLAGQKVSKSYKGVVIQNGKKFVQ